MKRKKKSTYSIILAIAFFLFFSPVYLLAQNSDETYHDADDFNEEPVWRQAMGGFSIGHPVAQVESVVIITDGGNLRSFSSQGKPLWNYYARGRLTPYASRSREGTSYICRTNGLLIAVNRAGRELWTINLGTPLVFPVLIGWDSRLFVFTEKKVTCMTAAGYTLWSRTLESNMAFAPIRDIEGGIILAQEDGEIIRLDPFGNSFSYSSETVPAVAASIEIEGWGHSILLAYEDRHIEMVYPSLGLNESLKGTLDLPSPPMAAAGRNNEAAVLLKDGSVVLISPENKKTLWTARSHIKAGELPSRPGLADIDFFYDERGIYALTRTGASGFTQDGRRLWVSTLKGAASLPSFGDDGILYSGGTDWILYAYRLEDRVRAKQRLLYGEAPEGDYGTGNPDPSSFAGYHFRFEERELLNRLREIREAVSKGEVGAAEREYAAWLMETSGSVLANPRPVNHPPVETRHRIEAAKLLAYIGSSETVPFLAELFARDPEVLVKAAAAEAIGKIGVDPEGLALRAFQAALSPPSILRDEALLTAIAGAVGALCRFSGPPLSDAGVRLLTILSGSDKPPPVRNRAQMEIRSL